MPHRYNQPQPECRRSIAHALAPRPRSRELEGEVRFDEVSRALYSTDASVYQIEPLGVVVVKSRDDMFAPSRSAASTAAR